MTRRSYPSCWPTRTVTTSEPFCSVPPPLASAHENTGKSWGVGCGVGVAGGLALSCGFGAAVGEEEALVVAVGLDAPNVVGLAPHPTRVNANEAAMIRAARLVTWAV